MHGLRNLVVSSLSSLVDCAGNSTRTSIGSICTFVLVLVVVIQAQSL